MADLGDRIGDAGGEQLKKFERGVRDLPLTLLARLAVETAIPLKKLASKEQRLSADQIVEAVVGQSPDAAA